MKLFQVQCLASGSHRGGDLWEASELDFKAHALAIPEDEQVQFGAGMDTPEIGFAPRCAAATNELAHNQSFPGGVALGMSEQGVGIGDPQKTVQNARIGDINRLPSLRACPDWCASMVQKRRKVSASRWIPS